MLYRKNNQKRKGQALLEYALLIAGVAMISMAAVSLLGHKTSDLIGAVTVILPGAHTGDNGPIISGHLIETTDAAAGPVELDTAGILTQNGTDRLGRNFLGPTAPGAANGLGGLIIESE